MAKDDLDTVDEVGEAKRKEQTIVFQSETFFSLAKRKCKTFFTNVTLEPVMLFYGIVGWVLCHKLSSFSQFTMTTFIIKKEIRLNLDAGASTRLPPVSLYWTKPASTTLDSLQKSVQTCSIIKQIIQSFRYIHIIYSSIYIHGYPIRRRFPESIKEFAQNEVAQFGVYESIVDHLFPIICSFFLGSWSDSFGRKWLLYFYFLIRWQFDKHTIRVLL